MFNVAVSENVANKLVTDHLLLCCPAERNGGAKTVCSANEKGEFSTSIGEQVVSFQGSHDDSSVTLRDILGDLTAMGMFMADAHIFMKEGGDEGVKYFLRMTFYPSGPEGEKITSDIGHKEFPLFSIPEVLGKRYRFMYVFMNPDGSFCFCPVYAWEKRDGKRFSLRFSEEGGPFFFGPKEPFALERIEAEELPPREKKSKRVLAHV